MMQGLGIFDHNYAMFIHNYEILSFIHKKERSKYYENLI